MNVVEVVNATRTSVDEELVARLVGRVLEEEGIAGAEVSVTFVGDARIRELNRAHRGRDEVTDVLSFPLEEWEPGGESAGEGAAAWEAAGGESAAGKAAGREAAGREAAGGAPAGGAPPPGRGAVVAASVAPDLGEVAQAAVSGVPGPPLLLGDVVICARRALRQARADGLPPSLEVAVLLAHGTLHLLGYDHETDAGRMALRQAQVLELVEWEGLVVAPPR